MTAAAAVCGAAAQAASMVVCLLAGSAVYGVPRPAFSAAAAAAASGAALSMLAGAWGAAAQTAVAALLLRFAQHLGWRPSMLISLFVITATHFWLFASGVLFADFLPLQAHAGAVPASILTVLAVLFSRPSAAARKTAPKAAAAAATGAVLILPLLWQTAAEHLPADAWITWMALAIVLVGIVLVGRSQHRYTAARQLADRTALEQAETQRHYHELESVIRANATLYHDMRHHLSALDTLLADGKTQEAREYVQTLRAGSAEAAARRSEDTILDRIIAAKTTAADGLVDVAVDCRVPSDGIVSQAELVSVVGNLLDNAVEAAEKSGADQPFAELTIRPVGDMLMIRTRNSCAPEAAIPDTNATAADLHGWGLVSVRDIAERYDGAVHTWREAEVYCVAASLRFQDPA